MTFDPALPTLRDDIRDYVSDTSNDPAIEFRPDVTYDAIIARYGATTMDSTAGYRATADMAERVATTLDMKVNGVTLTGDVAAQWTDRAKTLRANATRLRNLADTLDPPRKSSIFTITTVGQMSVDA